MDYAHIEEIRNAIRIFNESHRVHRSPNVDHNPVFAMARNSDPKLSMAFGYSFGWSEYFLASSFSNVYLQPRGYLDLSGSAVSNIFFRDMLNKYGIKVHVFKHGDFKSEHLYCLQDIFRALRSNHMTCIALFSKLHLMRSRNAVTPKLMPRMSNL